MTVAALILIGVGILIIFGGVSAYGNGQATHNWTQVPAVILESRVHEYWDDTTMYEPIIRYRYSYAGKLHESDRLKLTGITGSSHPSYAEQIVGRYPAGASVTVYVNPREPKKTVLEAGSNAVFHGFLILFGLPFLAAGLALLYVAA